MNTATTELQIINETQLQDRIGALVRQQKNLRTPAEVARYCLRILEDQRIEPVTVIAFEPPHEEIMLVAIPHRSVSQATAYAEMFMSMARPGSKVVPHDLHLKPHTKPVLAFVLGGSGSQVLSINEAVIVCKQVASGDTGVQR